jgi:uncharacterized protein (TIGR02391 family)
LQSFGVHDQNIRKLRVTDVIALSNLLFEADSIQRAAERLFRARSTNAVPDRLGELEYRYVAWYQAGCGLLPADLSEQFVRFYDPGTPEHPTISDFFRDAIPNTSQMEASAGETRTVPPISWWYYQSAFRDSLQQQRDFVFFARRRLWTGVSALPKGMRTAIATICKRSYQIFGIEDLFIRSGCEPQWYVPPFTPDPDSERMNEALGWLDGILLKAPEQETTIVGVVCETILAKPRLSAEIRSEVEAWLVQLQQPPPPSPNPLDRYNVHPTVRRIAGPLVASNHLNQALLNVCIALNETVQAVSGQATLDGSGLMQRVFSPNNPILRCAQDGTEQQGWMYLFTGVIMAIRNPRAHRLMDDLTETEAMEWLLFLSALFRTLEKAENVSTP